MYGKTRKRDQNWMGIQWIWIEYKGKWSRRVINEDHITQPHKKKQKWMSWEKTEKGVVGWSFSERKRWEV